LHNITTQFHNILGMNHSAMLTHIIDPKLDEFFVYIHFQTLNL